MSGQSRLPTCSGSRWGCAPQEMQRESSYSFGGARSPGAEERTAEEGRPEKGQLLVFGGLARVCGLSNFSVSIPAPRHLQIGPLLPTSLPLRPCDTPLLLGGSGHTLVPKEPLLCLQPSPLYVLATEGHGTAPPEAASHQPQHLDGLSQARGSQEAVTGTLGVPACFLSPMVSDTCMQDSGRTVKEMGRCQAPGHHTVARVPQTLAQD